MGHSSNAGRRQLLQGLGAAALLPWVLPAQAEDYPTKPVELVVPASAGLVG